VHQECLVIHLCFVSVLSVSCPFLVSFCLSVPLSGLGFVVRRSSIKKKKNVTRTQELRGLMNLTTPHAVGINGTASAAAGKCFSATATLIAGREITVGRDITVGREIKGELPTFYPPSAHLRPTFYPPSTHLLPTFCPPSTHRRRPATLPLAPPLLRLRRAPARRRRRPRVQ
jgi:hypothetical protein